MKFTIGADPELFFHKDNKLISVIGMLGGNKYEPKQWQEGFGILEDNVAAEFNIPPSYDPSVFDNYLDISIKYLEAVAKDRGLALSPAASGCFEMDQLEDPMAFVFGCEPDYNAWTRTENDRPSCDDPTLRSCGGHVHIGVDGFEDVDAKCAIVKACDLFLGVPSVRMDTDVKRRQLYGKAGAFRFKPYGVEYRTLSNFWIWKEDTRKWVFSQVDKALEFVSKNGVSCLDLEQEAIVNTINSNDIHAYKYLMDKYGQEIHRSV